MFINHIKKDKLLKSIIFLRRTLCGYDFKPPHKEPTFCDCKYGVKQEKDWDSEQTGCPELKCVEYLLSHISTDEFNNIMKRSNNYAESAPQPDEG